MGGIDNWVNSRVNKALLLNKILETLEAVHQVAVDAAEQAREDAMHNENTAENRYDTLGLEAAYLAQGQSKRVIDCEADLAAYKNMSVINFTQDVPVALGALICLKAEDDLEKFLFLGPTAGGLKFNFQDKEIIVITPSSPIGMTLLGRFVGDEFELDIGGHHMHYEVIAIY